MKRVKCRCRGKNVDLRIYSGMKGGREVKTEVKERKGLSRRILEGDDTVRA